MRLLITLTMILGLSLAGCADDAANPLAPATSSNDDLAPNNAAAKIDVSIQDAQANMPAVGNFRAHLDGDSEVPNAVDTLAQGQAVFRLSRDGSQLHYRLIVANIQNVVGAHVHLAPAGQNGPIVLPLLGNPFIEDPGVTVNGTLVQGTASAADVTGDLAGDLGALVQAMKMGNTYVNVHTTAIRSGEIRGQIR